MATRPGCQQQVDVQESLQDTQEEPRRLVVPLLHPIAITKGQWAKEPAQEAYIKRTKDRGYLVTDVTQPPPGGCLFPGLEDLAKFRPQITSGVSIDLETCADHIICAGRRTLDMNTYEVGNGITLRFRLRGGRLYWKWPEHIKAVEWFQEVLADPDIVKVFWNGVTFDVPLLMRAGFEVKGRFVDGMLLMRAAYLEMPSGLQYTATFFLGMPVWKTLVDEEEEDK